MSVIQYQRPDASVFLTVEHDDAHGWYHLRWIGEQTLSTVMDGGLSYLELLRRKPAGNLLHDHRAVRGDFSQANEWLATVWLPLLVDAGLRCMAHVLSPDVFAQISMESLSQRIGGQLELRVFDDVAAAEEWLLSCHG